jgi:glycosyltransferase involved in cell wall biosynthesis
VPNVVLESLSSGRAIISTDVGGISEIIEPIMLKRFLVGTRDKQAFAAAVMDALAHPVDEEALHQKALPFSWENCARNYLALLSSGV